MEGCYTLLFAFTFLFCSSAGPSARIFNVLVGYLIPGNPYILSYNLSFQSLLIRYR